MKSQLHLLWVFLAQVLLLIIAAWRNLHQLNPDAVAYLRIAGYYAGGQWELAVTGYWGPLLSWLMVPLLKAGAVPLAAARVVMAVSGVVFLCGAVAVFRAFRLPRVGLLTGAWLAAGWSVFWSVRNITPDLLLAGLVGLAVSATIGLFRLPCRHRTRLALWAGLWWGLAYLAKAVALPLAVLTTAGLAVLAVNRREAFQRELAARAGLVGLCTALVAAPWMTLLSLHYGKLTFSTTGPIAHALAGPGEQSHYHPAMVTLHRPETGRVTQWEEPSRMAYQRWSPFTSGENLRHQFSVVGGNLGICWDWLSPWGTWFNPANLPAWRRWVSTFDLLGLSAVAVVLAGCHQLKNSNGRKRWSLALIPVVCLGALYLPFWVQAEDQRYFYPAFPCLWVLAVGAWGWVTRCRRLTPGTRLIGFRVLSLSFAVPALIWLAAGLTGIPNSASQTAQALVAKLKAGGQSGPLAGSGLLPGGRAGLYTAFLLGERWLGDDPLGSPAEFLASGASIVVLRSGSGQAGVFARDARWRELADAPAAPLQVFVRANP